MAGISGSKNNQRTVHFTISLDEESARVKTQSEPTPSPLFVDEASMLETVNLTIVEGEHNTEHGRTVVRLIEFREEEHRQKLMQLLAESFPSILQQLTPYLYQLGRDSRAVVRARVAEAVGELMSKVDFIRYKEQVLMLWARSPSILMNSCVGIALKTVAEDPQYADNVRTLVKHWSTLPNRDLNWTAMASCMQLAPMWPEETLELLEAVLKRGQVDLLVLSILIIRRLRQEGHTDLVLRQLSYWLTDPESGPRLRMAAILIFLEVIDLSDVVGRGGQIDYAVDALTAGLSGQNLEEAGLVRSAVVDRLRDWIQESVDDPDSRATIEILLRRLYLRAETTRDKERIVYWLQRWSREKKGDDFAELARGLVQGETQVWEGTL